MISEFDFNGFVKKGRPTLASQTFHSAALNGGTAPRGPPAWRELRCLSRVPIRPSQIAQPQTHFWYLILTFLQKYLFYNHSVREPRLLHTQEVTGSSPVAPTTTSIDFKRACSKGSHRFRLSFASFRVLGRGNELRVSTTQKGRHRFEFRPDGSGRMKRCENLTALAEELGARRRLLYLWRERLDPIESRTKRWRRKESKHVAPFRKCCFLVRRFSPTQIYLADFTL